MEEPRFLRPGSMAITAQHLKAGAPLTKLVYIGGYGHSGSTLLEYLLTASPDVIACGEVASVVREGAKKKRCTCKRLAKDCPVWGSHLTSGASSHAGLDASLLAQEGSRYAVLVDSSKTAGAYALAPFTLRRKTGSDFLLVHLVRDPRAVCWSAIKKTERKRQTRSKLLTCCQAALGWVKANLACELFGRLYPNQYVRLRYEDLARSPREILNGLLRRLLPGKEWRFEAIGGHDNRHQLYGNRMRSKQLSLAEIREDDAWRTSMPAAYCRLIAPLSAVLRRRYGYS